MIGRKYICSVDNLSEYDTLCTVNLLDNSLRGVYFIYNTSRELVYIGKANTSIKDRLRFHLNELSLQEEDSLLIAHEKTERKKDFVYFKYTKVDSLENVEPLEIFLINDFNPKYNKKNNPKYRYPYTDCDKVNKQYEDLYLSL